MISIILFVLAGWQIWYRINPAPLTFSSLPAAVSGTSEVSPVKIEFPHLGITLPVIVQAPENGRIPTTPSGVTFLSTTAVPGETGNSILYGHNWANILKSLPRTKVGDEIAVTMSDGGVRRFTVERIETVAPDNAEVLAPSDSPLVTIYTCTGFLDSKRFVVIAAPQS